MKQGAYDRASQWFRSYGILAFFLSKLVPGMNFMAVACAGILRLDAVRAFAGILGSNVFVFGLLALAGKAAGERWRDVSSAMSRIGTAFIAVLAVTIVLIVIYVRACRKEACKRGTPQKR